MDLDKDVLCEGPLRKNLNLQESEFQRFFFLKKKKSHEIQQNQLIPQPIEFVSKRNKMSECTDISVLK